MWHSFAEDNSRKEINMRLASTNNIRNIAHLMEMENGSSPSPSFGGGNAMAQDALTLMTINNTPMGQSQHENDALEDEFSDTELKLAKRFIDILGSVERAQNLLDKVSECEECLGMIDDDEETDNSDDAAVIGMISNAVPSSPDMPMNMSSQYNPGGATRG